MVTPGRRSRRRLDRRLDVAPRPTRAASDSNALPRGAATTRRARPPSATNSPPGAARTPAARSPPAIPRDLREAEGIAREPRLCLRVPARREEQRARLPETRAHALGREDLGQPGARRRARVDPRQRRVAKVVGDRRPLDDALERGRVAQRLGEGAGRGGDVVRVAAAHEHDRGIAAARRPRPGRQGPRGPRLGKERRQVAGHVQPRRREPGARQARDQHERPLPGQESLRNEPAYLREHVMPGPARRRPSPSRRGRAVE